MVAKNPPRGWNSWDCFGTAVNEAQVKENAEYMAKYLKDYGWEYVVIDIQWSQPAAATHEYDPFSHLCMDEYGRLIPAENRFPSAANGAGFKPLADYIHSLGLKFGIHIMRGIPRLAAHNYLPIKNTTHNASEAANPFSICMWNPDMYGLNDKNKEAIAKEYYRSIFELYAEWGVDFVKVDDIAREYPHCKREIELISEAIKDCGREIVLSLSPGPAPLEQSEHLKEFANMWRITDDFWDKWELLLAMFERAEKWCTHSGPGHWPDADMLPVGALRQDYNPDDWTKFTEDEQITMMSLWCMMRAPLMAGAHLPKNDDFTLKLLTNKEVLDIEENTYGAHQLYRTDSEIAWITNSKVSADVYVALFNITDEQKMISFDFCANELCGYKTAYECWSGDKKAITDKLECSINAHGAKIFKLSK